MYKNIRRVIGQQGVARPFAFTRIKYRKHAEKALEGLDASEKIKRFLKGERSSDQWITVLFILLVVIATALSILIILFPDGSLNSTVSQRRSITPPGW